MARRYIAGVTALVVCTSCVPQHEQQRLQAGHVEAAPRPKDDHQLLRMLALEDPLSQPLPAEPALAPKHAAPPFQLGATAPEDAGRAADCLTAAVYYEARSEPLDGQRAVAQVVLNRVRDRAFPDSVCKVVYQRPAHGAGCQFSFACDGSTNRPIEQRAWAIARGVANAALNGSVYAPVGSATYYHTAAVLPWWAASLQRIGEIGAHIFYRWRDGLAPALSFRQAYSGVETMPAPSLTTPSLVSIEQTPAGAAQDIATRVESGVVVHRGSLVATEARPSLVRTSFGVSVHYGARVTADSDAGTGDAPPPGDTTAGAATS